MLRSDLKEVKLMWVCAGFRGQTPKTARKLAVAGAFASLSIVLKSNNLSFQV